MCRGEYWLCRTMPSFCSNYDTVLQYHSFGYYHLFILILCAKFSLSGNCLIRSFFSFKMENSPLKGDNPYLIVKFLGETHKNGKVALDIVPRKWLGVGLEPQRCICMFPPECDSSKIPGWASACIEPMSHWQKYDIEVLQGAGEKLQIYNIYKFHFLIDKVLIL